MVCIFKDTRELRNSILGAKTESKHSHYFTLTLRVWTWTPMTCSTNLVAWPLHFNLWTLETFELQGSIFTSISLTWRLHSNSWLELNNTAHQKRSCTLNKSSSFDSVMIVNLKQISFQRQAICPQWNWWCLKVTITVKRTYLKWSGILNQWESSGWGNSVLRYRNCNQPNLVAYHGWLQQKHISTWCTLQNNSPVAMPLALYQIGGAILTSYIC